MILSLLLFTILAGDSVPFTIRGKALELTRLQAASGDAKATVVFLPGDGGWRGAAIDMARAITTWNYDVYALDTKQYLETFSQNGSKLSVEQLSTDMRSMAEQLRGRSSRPLIFVGWSQGAAMAVAAAAGNPARTVIRGVLTIGLPEVGVLGWDWKATLATLARREPNQPLFQARPLLGSVSPIPVWMIHGSRDEYTTSGAAQSLFQATSEPKHYEEIDGADHRFDGQFSKLCQSMKAGLEWISTR